MDLWRVMFLLVVLLAVKVRCVSCPGDMWLETATPAPHLNRSAPLPEPHRNDSCDSHTVSCEPAESNGAKAVVGFNSAVTFFFFVVPMIRVLRLERNSRTKSDTQFWWYLCCGFSGYIVWVYYFSDCSSLHQAAVFPIYMVSILGAIVHFILLCIATYLTLGVRDKRPYALIFVLGSSLIGATLLWVFKVKWIGWLGFSLTALSHCFRFGATNYRDKFTFWLFDVSIPIWVVNAFISVVGSITGFLWLRHPQLCISMEYKVKISCPMREKWQVIYNYQCQVLSVFINHCGVPYICMNFALEVQEDPHPLALLWTSRKGQCLFRIPVNFLQIK